MSNLFRHFRPWKELLQIFFPRNCCCCGKELVGDEQMICLECLAHLPFTNYSRIPNNATEQCFMGRFPFEAATSFLRFSQGNSTQQILHQIKYYDNYPMAKTFGKMMGEDLCDSHRFDNVDLLIPVPLHHKKEWQRGYNQSLLLCQAIAEEFPRPISTQTLYRITHTESQTSKNREQRMENLQQVFRLRDSKRIEGKHILLIDDVITTGATTSECCKELLKAPGVKISIASLAIANR